VQWGEDGRGQLTLPAGEQPAPTMVLMLGAHAAAVDDPRVVRLTDALARTGFAVLIPLSAGLDRGEVTPGEIDRLVEAVLAAPYDPRTRADRLVLVGLSVGGSLALRAAADGRIAQDLDAVLALGPYYRAADMLAWGAAGVVRGLDGQERPWSPDDTTRRVLLASLKAAPTDDDSQAAAATDALTAALERRRTLTLQEAEGEVARLGARQRDWLASVSPADHLGDLRTKWYLVHDTKDRLIPVEESERIAAERQPDEYFRLDFFEHVTPHPTDIGTLLHESLRLITVFARVFAAVR
jgi:dienelactone hydrolase